MATTDRNDGAELDAFLSAHAPVKSDAHFAAGTVVGDWRLTGFLGRGGSSEVYRAVHAVSSKAAAVKMLLRDDAAARARFDREARFVNANEDAAFPRCLGAGDTIDTFRLIAPCFVTGQAAGVAAALAAKKNIAPRNLAYSELARELERHNVFIG